MIYVIQEAGSIGLSSMVIVADAYLQILEKNFLEEALRLWILPKSFRQNFNDSQTRFDLFEQATRFFEWLKMHVYINPTFIV